MNTTKPTPDSALMQVFQDNPEATIAFVLGGVLVGLFAYRDYGPRITSLWGVPRDWYWGSLCLYLTCALSVYVTIALAVFALGFGIRASFVPDTNEWSGLFQYWSQRDSNLLLEAGRAGTDRQKDADPLLHMQMLLFAASALLAIVVLFVPPCCKWSQPVRNRCRALGGMPGYLERVSGILERRTYIVPSQHRDIIEQKLRRLGVPSRGINWTESKNVAGVWTKLSSLVLRVVEMDSKEMPPSTRMAIAQLRERYNCLATRALGYFRLGRSEAREIAKTVRVDLKNPVEHIDLIRQFEKKVTHNAITLLRDTLVEDMTSLLRDGYMICARISVSRAWSRERRLRYLRDLGFALDRDPSIGAVHILMVFCGSACLLLVVAMFAPSVLAAFSQKAEGEFTPQKAILVGALFASSTWAGLLPHGFWGAGGAWLSKRRWRGLIVACLIASGIWWLLGLAFEMMAVPGGIAANGTPTVSEVISCAVKKRAMQWPWVITSLVTTLAIAVVVGLPIKKWSSWRRRGRDGLVLACAVTGGVATSRWLFERLDLPDAPDWRLALIVAPAIGLLIGGVVPEWKRLSESVGGEY